MLYSIACCNVSTGLVYMRYSLGLITEPCGTPYSKWHLFDVEFAITTLCDLLAPPQIFISDSTRAAQALEQ